MSNLPAPYRTRTPAETAANNARLAQRMVDGDPPPPEILAVLDEREPEAKLRLERLWQAAEVLGEPSLEFLRLCLLEVRYQVPRVASFAELVAVLEGSGWTSKPTFSATPIPGALWVEVDAAGEPKAVGIVLKVHKGEGGTQRDWFMGHKGLKAEKISFGQVGGWLLAPGGCKPCAERKR